MEKVIIVKDGPYQITGNISLIQEIEIVGKSGHPEVWEKGKKYPEKGSYILCRCGASKNKPFCDGTHWNIDFDGTETASRKKFMEQAEKIEGPELELYDVTKLCSGARFCNLGNGTWQNTRNSDNPESRRMAIQTACNCPSGRLVLQDKETQRIIEPKFAPSVSITEDPQIRVSGPIWLKGGIRLQSVDGTYYERRNRVTLCRCGKSQNKPFCDGSHIKMKFRDENL